MAEAQQLRDLAERRARSGPEGRQLEVEPTGDVPVHDELSVQARVTA
jgi:hypothetical protein